MNDFYLYGITALLPLTACMLIFQVNPYHALVIRGIFGAIAALVYAVLGAADVSLTEALVGTMLAITLYAVAVRSSLVMRLGVLKNEAEFSSPSSSETISETTAQSQATHPHSPVSFGRLLAELNNRLSKHHLRLELVLYPDQNALRQALMTKEIHATCLRCDRLESKTPAGRELPEMAQDSQTDEKDYHTETRIQLLYEMMQTEGISSVSRVTYVSVSGQEELH